jgi:hypothetical protein
MQKPTWFLFAGLIGVAAAADAAAQGCRPSTTGQLLFVGLPALSTQPDAEQREVAKFLEGRFSLWNGSVPLGLLDLRQPEKPVAGVLLVGRFEPDTAFLPHSGATLGLRPYPVRLEANYAVVPVATVAGARPQSLWIRRLDALGLSSPTVSFTGEFGPGQRDSLERCFWYAQMLETDRYGNFRSQTEGPSRLPF